MESPFLKRPGKRKFLSSYRKFRDRSNRKHLLKTTFRSLDWIRGPWDKHCESNYDYEAIAEIHFQPDIDLFASLMNSFNTNWWYKAGMRLVVRTNKRCWGLSSWGKSKPEKKKIFIFLKWITFATLENSKAVEIGILLYFFDLVLYIYVDSYPFDCLGIGHSKTAQGTGRGPSFKQSIMWHHQIKDYVEIDHLTKFNAFRLHRAQVMDFETWFKIHTSVYIFETAPPRVLIFVALFNL